MRQLKAQSCEAKTAAGSISYSLSRSPKRRTLTICVHDDQHVRVFAPLFLKDKEIQGFVERKASWIIRSLTRLRSRVPDKPHLYNDGEEFLFLGRTYRLCYAPSDLKRVNIKLCACGFEALVPLTMPHDQIPSKIKTGLLRWYRDQAQKIVATRLPLWRQKLNVDIQKVTVRSQKRLWGSCYYQRKCININWKIAMLPMAVIDYILAHELCHFYVPDHSRRFWDKLSGVCPDHPASEQWLKEHENLTRLG